MAETSLTYMRYTCLQHRKYFAQVLCPKTDQSQTENHKCTQSLECDPHQTVLFHPELLIQLLQTLAAHVAGNDDHPEPKSLSDNIFQPASMPQSHGKPQDQHSQIGRYPLSPLLAKLSACKAAHPDPGLRFQHRIHHVVFQPCTKGNMPPLPEFLYRCREKRISEILRKNNSQTLRCSQHNIHTA